MLIIYTKYQKIYIPNTKKCFKIFISLYNTILYNNYHSMRTFSIVMLTEHFLISDIQTNLNVTVFCTVLDLFEWFCAVLFLYLNVTTGLMVSIAGTLICISSPDLFNFKIKPNIHQLSC